VKSSGHFSQDNAHFSLSLTDFGHTFTCEDDRYRHWNEFMPKYPSSAQIRAGRGLLGWSRSDLAEKAGVALNTVTLMENKLNAQNHATRERVQKIMEAAGIAFFDDDENGGEGVRFLSLAHQPTIESRSK
jgi:hypothetical protein